MVRYTRRRQRSKSHFFTRSARSVNSGIGYVDRVALNVGRSIMGFVHRSAKRTKAITMKIGYNADKVVNGLLSSRRSRSRSR